MAPPGVADEDAVACPPAPVVDGPVGPWLPDELADHRVRAAHQPGQQLPVPGSQSLVSSVREVPGTRPVPVGGGVGASRVMAPAVVRGRHLIGGAVKARPVAGVADDARVAATEADPLVHLLKNHWGCDRHQDPSPRFLALICANSRSANSRSSSSSSAVQASGLALPGSGCGPDVDSVMIILLASNLESWFAGPQSREASRHLHNGAS